MQRRSAALEARGSSPTRDQGTQLLWRAPRRVAHRTNQPHPLPGRRRCLPSRPTAYHHGCLEGSGPCARGRPDRRCAPVAGEAGARQAGHRCKAGAIRGISTPPLPDLTQCIAVAPQVVAPTALLWLLLLPVLAAILIGCAVWFADVDSDTNFNWAEVCSVGQPKQLALHPVRCRPMPYHACTSCPIHPLATPIRMLACRPHHGPCSAPAERWPPGCR